MDIKEQRRPSEAGFTISGGRTTRDESLKEAQRLTRSHVTPSIVKRLNNKDINTKFKYCVNFFGGTQKKLKISRKGGNSRR